MVVLLGGVAAVGGLSFYLGDSHALNGLHVRRVTPVTVATAMRHDEFYSEYREDTLLVSGSVASVSNELSHRTMEFKTLGNFKTMCQLRSTGPALSVGERITVVTEAYTALRRPSAIMLSNCIVLSTQ